MTADKKRRLKKLETEARQQAEGEYVVRMASPQATRHDGQSRPLTDPSGRKIFWLFADELSVC